MFGGRMIDRSANVRTVECRAWGWVRKGIAPPACGFRGITPSLRRENCAVLEARKCIIGWDQLFQLFGFVSKGEQFVKKRI